MVHIKYKFLLLHKDLERRIIKERGSLTKSEKEELFYEMKSLYDESLELLTQYKNDEIELLRKGLLENE